MKTYYRIIRSLDDNGETKYTVQRRKFPFLFWKECSFNVLHHNRSMTDCGITHNDAFKFSNPNNIKDIIEKLHNSQKSKKYNKIIPCVDVLTEELKYVPENAIIKHLYAYSDIKHFKFIFDNIEDALDMQKKLTKQYIVEEFFI